MKTFKPKLFTLDSDNIPISAFKDLVMRRLFLDHTLPLSNSSEDSSLNNKCELASSKQVRIFSFTGVEISDEDEISMLESNSYLFASLGIQSTKYLCR